jgi:hypothetical protein
LAQAVTDVTFSTYFTINSLAAPSGGDYPPHSCAASKHPGGVNVSLADASGRFVSETVNTAVWRYMGDRDDRHSVTLP